jgi:hypothetical protein
MTVPINMIDRLPTPLFAIVFATIGLFAQQVPQESPRTVGPCTCPDFRIEADFDQVKAGDAVEFRIVSDDPKLSQKEIKWTVAAGTIIAGQGTRILKVQTNLEMLETPKETSAQTPAAQNLNGYFISGLRTNRQKIKVAANVEDPNCTCPDESITVGVGTQSVPANRPADVIDIKLSSDKLFLPYSPDARSDPSESMIVEVTTAASDPENDVLTFNYTVSGGRIIGRGQNIKWDLNGVHPGKYTITAGVDDGCGICGKTVTKTLAVIQN